MMAMLSGRDYPSMTRLMCVFLQWPGQVAVLAEGTSVVETCYLGGSGQTHALPTQRRYVPWCHESLYRLGIRDAGCLLLLESYLALWKGNHGYTPG